MQLALFEYEVGMKKYKGNRKKWFTLINRLQLVMLAAIIVLLVIQLSKIQADAAFFQNLLKLISTSGIKWLIIGVLVLGAALIVLSFVHILYGSRISKDLENSEEELRRTAERDDLTQLYNRKTAMRYLNSLSKDEPFTLLMINIDHFKDLNEVYGNEFGDHILASTGQRLLACMKDTNGYVARYGGDEFLVVVRGAHCAQDDPLIEKIRSAVRQPVTIGMGSITPTASTGAIYSDGKISGENAVVRAEIAVRSAKKIGRGAFQVFSDDMQKTVEQNVSIKLRIQKAIRADGFFMVYQPKVVADTQEVSGYEALVRMKDAAISPGVFIPIAEENGWLREIGRITTEKTIQQIRRWMDEGKTVRPVSVNFSSVQMRDTGYFDFLMNTLKKYNVPVKYFQIEITERVMLEFREESIALLQKFHNAGIKLLMDDFGTGYSSLSYLNRFPLDIIKIDKSFLEDNIRDDKKRHLLQDIIRLGHDLGTKIIVEGVETGEQYEYLREMRADEIQGFYFSKPLLPEDAIGFHVRTARKPQCSEASCG